MAALDLQEQEQLDTLKAWWKDNGNRVLGIVVVALVAVLGWRGWVTYQGNQAGQAATLYQQFVNQLNSNDIKRVNDAAAAVMDKYAGSAYAPRAALIAAQLNEADKDVAKAKTQLQWVIDHAKEEGLKSVAELRLASLLLDAKDNENAMKVLEDKHPASFDALFSDMKGDVLVAQGKPALARAAYQQAYDKLDSKNNYRNLVQMKMDALGAVK